MMNAVPDVSLGSRPIVTRLNAEISSRILRGIKFFPILCISGMIEKPD